MSVRIASAIRIASILSGMTPEQRRQVFADMDPADVVALRDDITVWLRDEQLWQPDTAPTITAYLAGRGWGKTLTGAATVDYVANHPELCGGRGYGDRPGEGGVIGIAGRTFGDVMETMLHGPSGLLSAVPLSRRPVLLMSRKRLEWPNGVVGRLMTGDEPDSFRGPNFGFLWADEIAHWLRARESWDNAMFGLRHGKRPRAIITTTPLGTPVLASILFDTDEGGVPVKGDDGLPRVRSDVDIVRGSTYENLANLGETYRSIIARYEGTRLGLQELHGQLLLDNPDAVIRREWVRRVEDAPPLSDLRVVVAVDPAVTSGEDSAESGVVIVAKHVSTSRLYLLDDLSGRLSPAAMDATVAAACAKYGAREVVVEDNNGGDYLEAALVEAKRVASVRRVKATRSKRDRWALVAGEWERGHVLHVGPPRRWLAVEHQLCDTDPNKGGRSDRGDAATWGLIYLTSDAADMSRKWTVGTLTEAMRRTR